MGRKFGVRYDFRNHRYLLFRILFSNLLVFTVSISISTAQSMPQNNQKMTVIQQWQVHRPVASGQLKDSAYEIMKDIGVTSLQSYVGWAQLEPDKGEVKYEMYDPVVNQLRKHELKWLPFLILGTKISTPKWFQEENGVYAMCLEHNIPTRIQSIWNPRLKQGIERFLTLFQKHYDVSTIEALNLGISGNWGESIYPVGGGFDMEGVHTHRGWWCGDKFARADFRRWLRKNFKTIERLNVRWGSHYSSFDDIMPFLPEEAPSQRAKVDLTSWYEESMTNYAEYWIMTARELFPTLPIYLCTGGAGELEHGANFSAQAKMCAQYNAGIRITNMSDDMQEGFAITRMVSSASRFYGGYYTTEPGGKNSARGVAGRIFDIVSGGGVGVYFKALYQDNESDYGEIPTRITENAEVFKNASKFLTLNTPQHEVAVLMSNSSIALEGNFLNQFLDRSAVLRDLLDFDYVDEIMISDDALENYRAIIMLSGETLKQLSIKKLQHWIERGGIFIASEEIYSVMSVEGYKIPWMDSTLLNGTKVFELGEQLCVNKMGDGYVVIAPANWDDYKRALRKLLFTNDGPWARIAPQTDGVFDNVMETKTTNSIYYYNNSDRSVDKEIEGGRLINIDPRTIVEIKN